MKRNASAEWKGGLKDGKGTISTDSGVLSNTQYSFGSRFEEGVGTNPEELIAAAHAGCFSMALSGALGRAEFTPNKVATKANVHLEKLEAGFTVTKIHLVCEADVPGIDDAKFQEIAEGAKANCPISRLLGAAAEITLEASLRA